MIKLGRFGRSIEDGIHADLRNDEKTAFDKVVVITNSPGKLGKLRIENERCHNVDR